MKETIGGRTRFSVFLRSFAIQGSWNYRTLLGTGFGFALLPALRVIYAGRPEDFQDAVRRHTTLFNCHPYLAGIALGAVARLESEGESAEIVMRFKGALRSALGSLGDRMVWAGLRPCCLLLALAMLLLGAPWWVCLAVFLAVYNSAHIALRWWSLSTGWSAGKHVAARLRESNLERYHEGFAHAGSFLLGLILPLVAVGALTGDRLSTPWVAAGAIGAGVGLKFGSAVRYPLMVALVIVALIGFLLRATS
ncbi:MAG: PTS system mannose/fructose/sorbose family transporter subunit IID [Longimicrobiales bacterium]